jgi:putative transposase
VKYAWIEERCDRYPVTTMCRLLEVSRSGYNDWRKRPESRRAQDDRALDAAVASLHTRSRRGYGRPRILRDLQERGWVVGHERVRKSLRRQRLRTVHPRPFRLTTHSAHAHPLAPNLLNRRFGGWQPDQAWVGDVTYIRVHGGWLYLACIMDLASRRIVGWSMSERITQDLVCQALRSAYWQRKPAAGLIMHTDRGSQYASDDHRKLLKDYRMVASMSRKANCWDNAPMESFFKTLKVECVYNLENKTRDAVRLAIVDWIEGFYNRQRRHSAIGYLTPVQAEST